MRLKSIASRAARSNGIRKKDIAENDCREIVMSLDFTILRQESKINMAAAYIRNVAIITVIFLSKIWLSNWLVIR